MELLLTFMLAFSFSFIGSIPPGTLNLTIVQLGIDNKLNLAWRFAAAAAMVEYPYAWLSIKFEKLITSSPTITENIQLITGLVMITLGLFNLLPSKKPSRIYQRFNESGFRRGLLLSALNPLALPFWLGVTAYLKSQQWINLSSQAKVQLYLIGIVSGAFVLLICLAYLAKRVVNQMKQNSYLRKLPGIALLMLGMYGLIQYLL